MIEELHIIARLSDSELLMWHEKFGMDRLNYHQQRRLETVLLPPVVNEKGPPDRKLTPMEWQMLKREREERAERDLEGIYAA